MEREVRVHKAPVNGPLLHWTKVLVLRCTMKAMHRANVIARAVLQECEIEGNSTGKAEADYIIKNNAKNLIKASELIDTAIMHVPIEWRSWPELN